MQSTFFLDVGNSALKAVSLDGPTFTQRIFYPRRDEDGYRAAFQALRSRLMEARLQPAAFHVLYVLDAEMTQKLTRLLNPDGKAQVHPIKRETLMQAMPPSCYDLSQLGLDRMMHLIAAKARLGSAPGVILSCGTALCVDLLQNGEHLGGWIQPGFGLWRKALPQATPNSPLPLWQDDAALLQVQQEANKLPATTESALQLGTVLPYLHGVIGLLKRILHNQEEAINLIVTGGDADLLLKLGFETVARDAFPTASIRPIQHLSAEAIKHLKLKS